MNPHNEHHDASLEQPLPGDLAPIALPLDRLALADRTAMPASLCDRIAGASAGPLTGRELAPHLDALSSSERAAASSSLEDRVFTATRGLIARAGGVHVHEAADRRAGARWPARYVWAGRLAAAAAVLLVGVLTLPMLRGTDAKTATAEPTPQIASAIASDLDELAELIDFGGARDDVAGLKVALRTVEDAMDDDLLRPALEDGGSL